MDRVIFDGILVLDLTQALAGPYCTQLLADFGAEVIKIERPRSGDQSRGWGPPFLAGESSYFLGTNRNKRSLSLDLKKPRAREILDRLIDRADVLVHNTPRRSTQEQLGIDAARVRARNGRIIWAAISGFGMYGPEAEKPGYDVIAQAMSGTMALTGPPESGPSRFPSPMADITTGMYTALGIMAALYERERHGEGQEIDVALFDSQTTWLSNIAHAYLATGIPPVKRGNVHPNIAPYQPFRGADGWFILAAGTESLWAKTLEVLGDAGRVIGADSRFRTNTDRVAHRQELELLMEREFSRASVATWIERFEAAGVPCGPILTPEEALNHPHIRAREMVVEMNHPTAGTVRALGNPIKMSRTPPGIRRAPPLLGADTGEILRSIGFSDDEIDVFRVEQVV